MKTVRALSRHCLLLSWLKHYWSKDYLLTQEPAGTKADALVRFLLWYISPHQQLQSHYCYRIFFLLHCQKAVVCYPELVLLLLGDYKTAPHCSFPLFWLNLQSSMKMNPAKVTSQRISSCEKEEVWKPRPGWARMVNWDSGCMLIPGCAASVPALSSTERRHDAPDTALSCCWEQQGTSGGFPILYLL